MPIRLWRPLSARLAASSLRELVSSTPSDPLERKLREWIEESIAGQEEVVHRIALRLDMESALDDEADLWEGVHYDDLYDVIDAVLNVCWTDTDALQQLLDDGLSAYTIAPDGNGLTTRTDPIATAALNEATDSAKSRYDSGSAAYHLTAAWRAAYGIEPDQAKAYSESIKAVEAAAHSLIEPSNSKATLGTMLRQMRDHPGDYRLTIPAPGAAAEPVMSMMSVLWRGQTSRHGGQTPTRMETPEEARAAVHLAVMLVHWFSTGIVRRTATPSS